MLERSVGVLGASGLVGGCLLPRLREEGWRVVAYSRRLPQPVPPPVVSSWISLAPIWVLPDFADLMESAGVRRVVALSSTSRFSKQDSSDPAERQTALRLAEGERWLAAWAGRRGVQWAILRPTLIYGQGRDRNVAEIARFIRRFGFFPLVGGATGLRQPLHVEDVARACIAALESPTLAGRAYDLSGGETLSYRDMVCRIFAALGRRPRLPVLPLGAVAAAIVLARLLPPCRHWRPAMAARMNVDLVFDHGAAGRDLGFEPRRFEPARQDAEASP